jgi:hypothetical protein
MVTVRPTAPQLSQQQDVSFTHTFLIDQMTNHIVIHRRRQLLFRQKKIVFYSLPLPTSVDVCAK